LRPITQIWLFDFDGTLFRAPRQPDWWGGYQKGRPHWWSHHLSLTPPCVPQKPGARWWVASSVKGARAAARRKNVYSILATGRNDNAGLRYRIHELLRVNGLYFDDVRLNPDTKHTPRTKKRILYDALVRFPHVRSVHIWEDQNMDEYCGFIERFAAHTGRPVRCVPHHATGGNLPPVCSDRDFRQS